MAHWRAVTVTTWYGARALGSQQQAFEHHENVSVLCKEELFMQGKTVSMQRGRFQCSSLIFITTTWCPKYWFCSSFPALSIWVCAHTYYTHVCIHTYTVIAWACSLLRGYSGDSEHVGIMESRIWGLLLVFCGWTRISPAQLSTDVWYLGGLGRPLYLESENRGSSTVCRFLAVCPLASDFTFLSLTFFIC